MTNAAQEALDKARQIGDAKYASRKQVDYDALNKMVKRQRAALTRAVNSGDVEKIILTVQSAVREWNQPEVMWPDDWSRWQNALNDHLPLHQQIDIADLA